MFVPDKIADMTKGAVMRQGERIPGFKPGQGITLYERPTSFLRYSVRTPGHWVPAVGAAMGRAEVKFRQEKPSEKAAQAMRAIARATRKLPASA